MSFDNTVRENLGLILQQYGRSICEDSRRCGALLKDMCNGSNKLEVNLLIIAQKEGAVSDLLSSSNSEPAELQYSRLAQKLMNEHAIKEDAAYWAVISWASALGLSVPEAFPIPSPPKIMTQKPDTHGTEIIKSSESKVAAECQSMEMNKPNAPPQNKSSKSDDSGCCCCFGQVIM